MGAAQLLAVTGLRWLPGCPASVPSNQRWWAESFSPSSLSDPFQRAEETVLLVCRGQCHRSGPLERLGYSANLRSLVLATSPGPFGTYPQVQGLGHGVGLSADRRPINRAMSSESSAHPLRASVGRTKNSSPAICRWLARPHRPAHKLERTACSCQDWGLLEAGPFLPQGPLLGPEGLQLLSRAGER